MSVNVYAQTVLYNITVTRADSSQLGGYNTLAQAITAINNDGTTTTLYTITVNNNLSAGLTTTPTKPTKIVGSVDTIKLTFTDAVTAGEALTFDNITLSAANEYLYANGNPLVLGSGLKKDGINNSFHQVFGGTSNTASSGGTSVTIAGGSVKNVYGGGANVGAALTGDTNVTITGGTVSDVYGGGYNGAVAGSTNVTVTGGTVNDVCGGGYSGTVTQNTNVTITGGTMIYVYGGGRNVGAALTGDTNVTITGGTVSRVYGGGNNGAVTGDIKVTLVGGTVGNSSVYGKGSTESKTGSIYLPSALQAKASAGSYSSLILVDNAVLATVKSQAITATGDGTKESPKTASITVANTVTNIAAADIVTIMAGYATAQMYDSSAFSNTSTSQPINEGVNHIYIKVSAYNNNMNIEGYSEKTVLYYDVTVNSTESGAVTLITIDTHPTSPTNVTEGSISGSLSVAASVTQSATLSYQWYSNTVGDNSSGTSISGATNASFTIPTTLSAGTYYYFCEVSATGGAASERSGVAVVNVASEAVTPVITIDTHPALTTNVTEGSISGSLSVAASVTQSATLSYEWFSCDDANRANPSSTGETTDTFAIPTNLSAGTYYYYCEVSATGGAASERSGVAVVNVASEAVTPVITIDTHPALTTNVTVGSISGSLSVAASVTQSATPSYQWYSNTVGGNTGGAASERSGVAVVNVASSAVTPVITIDTHPALTTNVTEGSISGSLSVAASVTQSATPSYQWYSNTVGDNSSGTSISGATNASFTIPTTLSAGTYYYFCEVSATGGAASERSGVAVVNVASSTVITIDTHPALTTNVTEGSISGSLSVAASVTQSATLSYQWYSNTVGDNSSGTSISGATNASFTIPTTLSAGTYYYFCEVSATGGAASERSGVAVVNVASSAVTPVITIDTHPALTTNVTEGSISGSLSVAASVTQSATLSYEWFSCDDANRANPSSTGETTDTFTIPTNLSAGTYYYYCEVSATGGAASERSGVAVVNVASEAVTPVITIDTHPALTTNVTEGSISGSLSVAASVTQSATPSYQWYSNTVGGNTGGTSISGATSASFTIPTTLSAGTYYYFCEVSATGGAASERSGVAVVNVASSAVTPVITIDTHPALTTNVTEGSISGSLSVAASVTQSATPSYQWYSNTVGDNSSGTSISGATSASFTIPTTLSAGTYYYFCEVSATGGAAYERSGVAVVNVASSAVTPVITIDTHPTSPTNVTEGSISGSLSVAASVTQSATPSYEWFSCDDANRANPSSTGETTDTFTIPTNLSAGTYYYYCEVSATGGAGSVKSNVAKVVVGPTEPPVTGSTTPAVTSANPIELDLNAVNTAYISISLGASGGSPNVEASQADITTTNGAISVNPTMITTDGNITVTGVSVGTATIEIAFSGGDIADNAYDRTITVHVTDSYIPPANTHTLTVSAGTGGTVSGSASGVYTVGDPMVSYAKATGYKLPVSRTANVFADDAKISSWATDAVKVIQQAGVISGKSNNVFDPSGNATRAEASKILRRFIELVIDKGTARGWSQNDSGQWMYYNAYGKRTSDNWLNITNGNKYYFDKNGIMVSGKWVQIGDKWYYFYADGKLAVNTTVDGYEVSADGARKP